MPRKIVITEFGGPDVLRLIEAPEATAGPGQVRIRIRAAGVNPVDGKLRRGELPAMGGPAGLPRTLGNEFAGVIDQVGAGVTGLGVGSEVLGFATAEAYTDQLVVPADSVTPKPAGLSWEVAGGLSAVGQTAWNALAELEVKPAETLLIHAAAGGVGTVAVQLAVRLGARVIGTASAANHEYLRSLGATAVAYGPGLVERVRQVAPDGVHVALDAVGGAAIDASLDLVADRRRIGTLVDQQAAERHGIRRLRGTRSARLLAELAGLCAAGELVLPVAATFSLERAAEAHRLVDTGHVRGKVVLTVD